MKIWTNINNFKGHLPVVTIGIFDGVHAGHHFLLNELKKTAAQIKGETVVVTLWPHPRAVLNKDPDNLRYLTSIEEKTLLLRKAGIDHLFVLPFTQEFSKLDSCEFVKDYLVKGIKLHFLLVGFNHKFGKNREGDFERLKDCADAYSFGIKKLEPRIIDGKRISSTLIRNALNEGRLEEANKYLGYAYFIQGRVVGGNRVGREIGFPTANIQAHDAHKLIPHDGVYVAKVLTKKGRRDGMLNIGYRPTFDGGENKKSIEVHIFDFEGDIYHEDISLYFVKKLREEKKFSSVQELKAQLIVDKRKAIEVLKQKNSKLIQ